MFIYKFAEEIELGSTKLSIIKQNGELHNEDKFDIVLLIYKTRRTDTVRVNYYNIIVPAI
ncbi:MAG: hypothetical protein LBL90_02805 [Prevotellaceae bacterium]|nr:hypothetical protein [Prevotellaceae bacterium]